MLVSFRTVIFKNKAMIVATIFNIFFAVRPLVHCIVILALTLKLNVEHLTAFKKKAMTSSVCCVSI